MDQRTLQLVSSIPGWLSTHEGQFLSKATKIVSNIKGEIVEIGSFQGKSTIHLAINTKLVHAIDPHPGKLDNHHSTSPTLKTLKSNLKKAGLTKKVSIIKKTSRATVKGRKLPIKLLFIDGLHDYKNALLDYQSWNKHLVNNSVIAMHDSFCGWPGAGRVAIHHIVNNPSYKEIGVVGSIIYGIKGKPTTLEKLNLTRCRRLISFATLLHKNQPLPQPLNFFAIHRMLKALLLNRFTLKRT